MEDGVKEKAAKAKITIRPLAGWETGCKGFVLLLNESGLKIIEHRFVYPAVKRISEDTARRAVSEALKKMSVKKFDLAIKEQKSAPPGARFFLAEIR